MILSREQSLEIVDRALVAAEGDEADVMLVSTDRNVSRFANSNVHQNMSEESGEIVIRVIADSRMGVASTSSFREEDLRSTAALALDMARRSQPLDGFTGLSSRNDPTPELATFDEATALLAPADTAHSLRTMFDRGRERDVTFAGSFSTLAASVAAGNSHGIRRWAPLTSADLVTIAVTGETSGFATRMSRRVGDIDTAALGDEATDKALLLRDETATIEPGRYDVILEPPAIAEILEWMNMITFSGQSYEDGSSFFVGQIGEKLLGSNLTLVDDPLDESAFPFPFDGEGLARRRNPLVEEGVVRGPVLDTLVAARLGLPVTANAASPGGDEHGMALHLSLAGGDTTREELIASTERGIWVTRFHYLNGLIEPRTATMTGMTRDGTFLVEEGRVTRRLPNLRWTQSMVEAFSNVEGLTKERRIVGTWWNLVGGTIAPTIKVGDWTISGVQKR